MKVITICQKCSGRGRKRFLQFFSRSCSHCGGKGKTVKRISDQKKYQNF